MKLSTRIFLGFVAIVLIFAAALAFTTTRIATIREDLAGVQRDYVNLARHATQLRTLQEAKDEYVERARLERSPAVRRQLIRTATEYHPRASRARLKELYALTEPGDAAFKDLRARLSRIEAALDAHDLATTALLDSELEDDGELLRTYESASLALSREVRSLSFATESRVSAALRRAESAGKTATVTSVALSFFAFVVGVIILLFVQRALNPLRQLLESVRRISKGDLSTVVPEVGAPEVADLAVEFNAMTKSLQDREETVQSRGEELLALKAFSDDVIRSVRIGIVILDPSGNIRSLNPAARSVFGLPLVDLEGRALKELPELSDPLAAVVDELPAVLGSGEVRTFELLELGERLADVALVPIRDRTGAARDNVLLLGEDVSAREKTRKKLVESERLAAIGRLAAQITHEIRNPLSSVALNIELLGDDVEFLPNERQGEARAILSSVAAEVERLTEITEGYLRFARLPAPRAAVGDVGDLLADLAAFTQSEAAQADVMLELRVDDDLPEVPHDPPRLRQAFLNLLRNGLEAAGRHGTVRLSARRSDVGGVEVRIEDSGSGVPEEVRARLFEPFFTTKPEGTGLGLTLTKEIVDEHTGELGLVDSSLGGAGFSIRLPKEARKT